MRPALIAIVLFIAGFSIYLAEGALHIPSSRRIATPLPPKYSEATVQSDGLTLKGEYRKGANGSAILLLHGIGDTRRGMRGFAEWLHGEGFSVLLPDSRAHGVSGGNLVTYGVAEANDVSRWIDWLQEHDQPTSVMGLGESMGGSVLLQSLPQGRLAAVVSECAYSTFRSVAYDRLPLLLGLPLWLRPLSAPFVETAILYTRVRYGVNLGDADAHRAMRGAWAGLLIIHGLNDDRTPPRHARDMFPRRSHVVTELWEVPKAGHVNASVVAPGEFRSRVGKFFHYHRELQEQGCAEEPRASTTTAPSGPGRTSWPTDGSKVMPPRTPPRMFRV